MSAAGTFGGERIDEDPFDFIMRTDTQLACNLSRTFELIEAAEELAIGKIMGEHPTLSRDECEKMFRRHIVLMKDRGNKS